MRVEVFKCPHGCGWAMHTLVYRSSDPRGMQYPVRSSPPIFCPKCEKRL